MAVKVFIPTPLRVYTGQNATVEVEGKTVEEVLRNLTSKFGEIQRHLYAENGSLRSYVNLYVNDEDIRYLEREKTHLRDSDTLSIVPSIAGGSGPDALTAEPNVRLQNDEVLRYSRHLIIPEIGMKGQKLLKASRVLIIGAGGLGSPLALYLAAAGVGTIGIVDFDLVELTNLQRQILHATRDIGKPKLESAREAIQDLNPHVTVIGHEVRLTSENALEIMKDYDVIVDGTDNFATRYLVNDACVILGKPNVYGSIFRFDGQVTVFDAQRGPCYRCLYPTPPPPGLIPSCAEGGVLGVLPGIIGTLQALETIKLIVGQGEPLVGRLLLLDALQLKFRELKLKKDPECPVCGDHPTIHELIDYEEFCGIGPAEGNHNGNHHETEITVEQLKERLDRGEQIQLVDVREPHEYEIVNLGAKLIPLRKLPERVQELDPSKEIVVHCKVGERSERAAEFLRSVGYKNVKNLVGGIRAWAEKIDPSLPKY
ncbi:molybdopterin-synthase adenylyltransferase MoeB [bacterium]|nr:MAG: molybdopterin-synthase adenylyltransferase MoeB [bacterium]